MQILIKLNLNITIFCDIIPCHRLSGFTCLEGMWCLDLQASRSLRRMTKPGIWWGYIGKMKPISKWAESWWANSGVWQSPRCIDRRGIEKGHKWMCSGEVVITHWPTRILVGLEQENGEQFESTKGDTYHRDESPKPAPERQSHPRRMDAWITPGWETHTIHTLNLSHVTSKFWKACSQYWHVNTTCLQNMYMHWHTSIHNFMCLPKTVITPDVKCWFNAASGSLTFITVYFKTLHSCWRHWRTEYTNLHYVQLVALATRSFIIYTIHNYLILGCATGGWGRMLHTACIEGMRNADGV